MTESVVENERTCRFCLGTTENTHNIFVSPCICMGSIQYVHTYCLTRWRISQSPMINTCSICHTKYNVEICFKFEKFFLDETQIKSLFRNGAILFFCFNYFYLFFMTGHNLNQNVRMNKLIDKYDSFEDGIYKPFYSLVMIIIMSVYNGILFGSVLKVQNKKIYFKEWMKRERIHLAFCLFVLIITSVSGPSYYFIDTLLHTIYHPILLLEHKRILEKINMKMVENVQQFEE